MQYMIMILIVIGLAIADFATGYIKAYCTNTVNSQKMRQGGMNKLGELIVMLTACGLETTLRVLPAEEFQSALAAGNFDLYYGEVRLPANQELTAFFTPGSQLAIGGLAQETRALTLSELALANRGNAYDLQNYILSQGLLCPVAFKSTACYVRPGAFTGTAPQLNGWLWR